ncbi:MAG: alpha/beta fold hydrolase [Acetobacteraceae bacterium]|nr:alpha/beta fold hydrolase [Acetobacteraceae bacterium]
MPTIDTGRISLSYEQSGTGDPPALLLHELGGSSESWWKVASLLAARRRVIAVDLRGAGRSEKAVGPFELTDVADDVTEAVAGLGIRKCDVVGAALGSLVGAVLTLRHPMLVRRLAMFAVADVDEPTQRYLTERASRLRDVGMRGVADASLANAFPSAHAAARAAYRGIYLANDPAAYGEMSLALARFSMTPEQWGRIAAPVLVASGAHDFIWPPEAGRRIASLIPGAAFEVLPDAGHFPHLQTPEALAGMVGSFLDAPGL